MKIYISGRITGLDYTYVVKKFNDAKDLLESLGFEVINPLNNGLGQSHTWRQHIVRDVEMLLPCEAIYMLDNWMDSVGAGIEYDISMRTGKDILFETNIVQNKKNMSKIKDAIHEITGMPFNEYITKSRKSNQCFSRMMFVHHCRDCNMKLEFIAKQINRDHTSIIYLLKKYEDEINYNPVFRDMAIKVDKILNRDDNYGA